MAIPISGVHGVCWQSLMHWSINGIDAAKALIAKSKKEGAAVQQTLDGAIAELNTVVATITPAKAK